MAVTRAPQTPAMTTLRRRRITVKFAIPQGVELPYVRGPTLDAAIETLVGTTAWTQFRTDFPAAVFGPLVPTMRLAFVADLVSSAKARDPDYRDPDFFSYFMVSVAPGTGRRMLRQLRSWRAVQAVYLDPGPPATASCSVDRGANPEAGRQVYLDDAPLGIGAEHAWCRAGGAGEGQVLAVVEADWHQAHEDLPGSIDPATDKFTRLPGSLDTGDALWPHPNGGAGKAEADRTHGTKTLGVIAGVDNGLGIIGIAPQVMAIALSSTWRPGPAAITGVSGVTVRPSHEWPAAPTDEERWIWSTPETAICDAVDWIKARKPDGGGVLLLEVEDWLPDFLPDEAPGAGDPDPAVADVYVPLEVRLYVHHMIKAAVAAGIVVISPAANGAVELESLTMPFPGDLSEWAGMSPEARDLMRTMWPVDLVNPAMNDSGSIMVGAATPTPAPTFTPVPPPPTLLGTPDALEKHSKSNFGQRVDAFAWGNDVWTSTWRAGIAIYYDNYGGTSSASAIMAGVALVLQGIHEECKASPTDPPLDPMALRAVIRQKAYGSPSHVPDGAVWKADDVEFDEFGAPTPLVNLIGYMPDLKKIIEDSSLFSTCTIAPDVYVRDEIGDDGDSHLGIFSKSPDIISRAGTKTQAEAQAEWGEGSGKEDSDDLSFSVLKGMNHSLWVRVRNRGNKDADAVRATVYYAEPSTLILPADWTKIGEIAMGRVCRGEELTLSPPIPWPIAEIPVTGDYCFIAVLDTADDPAPDHMAITTADEYLAFIGDNNNVAWRNFNVIYFEPQMQAMPRQAFTIPGAFDTEMHFDIELETNKPHEVQLSLLLPAKLHNVLSMDGGIPIDRGRYAAVDLMTGTGFFRLGGGVFRVGDRPRVTLRTRIPAGSVRQPFGGHGAPVAQREVRGRYHVALRPTARGQPAAAGPARPRRAPSRRRLASCTPSSTKSVVRRSPAGSDVTAPEAGDKCGL